MLRMGTIPERPTEGTFTCEIIVIFGDIGIDTFGTKYMWAINISLENNASAKQGQSLFANIADGFALPA